MQALSDHLTDTTIALTTDITTTAALTTAATIVTVAVIRQKDLGLAKITTADQTTSSPPSINLVPSATTTNSTKRSSMARALFTRTPNTR